MAYQTIADILAAWPDEISRSIDSGTAVCIGLFEADGTIRFLNSGMRQLLQPASLRSPQLSYLLNPTLNSLSALPTAGGLVYKGWITFGGPALPHRSLRGSAWQQGTQLLILAEYDVEELELVSREVIDLNGEITNLQRELARKNAALQKTLNELRETQAMLIQAEKMSALGQMVAGIAHEINNPIAFVHSNLHSLRESVLDIVSGYQRAESLITADNVPDQIAQLDAIRTELDLDFTLGDIEDLLSASVTGILRVKRLIENLRTFSRLDEAEFKEVNLSENIQSALMIAQPQFGDRINILLELDDLPPFWCFAAELNQVFLNLIINAGQAIEGQGEITIRGADADDHIRLVISDTGTGMTPDVAARAFDPFFTTKPVGSGTGLGLTIVYKIITDRHRGTVEIDTQPGEGTSFIITLPKLDAPPDSTTDHVDLTRFDPR